MKKRPEITLQQVILLNQKKSGDKLYDLFKTNEERAERWYKYTLLDMWLKGKSYSAISRDTNIPRTSLMKSVKEAWNEFKDLTIDVREEVCHAAYMWIEHLSKYNRTQGICSVDIRKDLIKIVWLNKDDTYRTMVFMDDKSEEGIKMHIDPSHS